MTADNGRIMSGQILSAVRYLNCNKIIHGNINFDNIFIFDTSPPTFKLAGLGLAIHAETPSSLTKDCSTAELRAPEVLPRDHVSWQQQLSFGENINVYSFGLLLYHTMTKGPLPDFSTCICATDRYERRAQWRMNATLLRPYSPALKDFIEWVLQKEPAARLNAERCLQHRWISWSSESSHKSWRTKRGPQKDKAQVDSPPIDSSFTDELVSMPKTAHPAPLTFYDLLLIVPSASEADIQKSYRTVALKFHPDKDLHDPGATERFQELRRVYDILVDPERRKAYDKERLSKG